MSRFTFSPISNSIEHYHTIDVSPADSNTGISACTIDTIKNATRTDRNVMILAKSLGGTGTIGPGVHAVLEQLQSSRTDSCVVCSLPPGIYQWTLRTMQEHFAADEHQTATILMIECADHPREHTLQVQDGHLKVNDHVDIRASLATGDDEHGVKRNILLVSYEEHDGSNMLSQFARSQSCVQSSWFDGSLRMLYRGENGDVKGADSRHVLKTMEWAKEGALSACDYKHTDGTCSAGWTSSIDELKKGWDGNVDLWVLGPMTDQFPLGTQDDSA